MPSIRPLALLTILVSGVVALADFCGLRQIASWGGPVRAMTVAGDYALIAVGSRLIVADLVHPPRLHEVGRIETGLISSLAATGSVAYACASDRMLVVSIADPEHPALVASMQFSQPVGPAHVVEGVLYAEVGIEPEGLGVLMIDIADPQQPTIVETYVIADADVSFFGFSGTSAYAQLTDGRLRRLSLATPFQPTFVADIAIAEPVSDALDAGDFAYLSTRHGPLIVLDQSDLGAPQIASWGWLTASGALLASTPSRLFVASDDGVQAFSLADPAYPSLQGWRLSEHDIVGIEAVGERSLVGSRDRGVELLDWTYGMPSVVGSFRETGAAYDIHLVGDVAYLAGAGGGLAVLDIADLSAPVTTALLPVYPPAYVEDLSVDGDWLYLTAGGKVHVMDRTDARRPVRRFVWPIMGVGSVHAVGNTVLLTADDEFIILDAADRAAPVELARVALQNYAQILDVLDGFAYVASADRSLYVIDVRAPSEPLLIANELQGGPYRDIAIRGGFGYLAKYEGVSIVDITNPAIPTVVGEWNDWNADWIHSVEFVAEDLVAADAYGRVYFLDVADPQRPFSTRRVQLGGWWPAIAAVGDTLLSAGYQTGMRIWAPVELAGDLDADGDVDLSDLARLLVSFGDPFVPNAADDLTCDGNVDLSDLALLLANFGTVR